MFISPPLQRSHAIFLLFHACPSLHPNLAPNCGGPFTIAQAPALDTRVFFGTKGFFNARIHWNSFGLSVLTLLYLLHSHKHCLLLVILTSWQEISSKEEAKTILTNLTMHAFYWHLPSDLSHIRMSVQVCSIFNCPGLGVCREAVHRVAKAGENWDGNQNSCLSQLKNVCLSIVHYTVELGHALAMGEVMSYSPCQIWTSNLITLSLDDPGRFIPTSPKTHCGYRCIPLYLSTQKSCY